MDLFSWYLFFYISTSCSKDFYSLIVPFVKITALLLNLQAVVSCDVLVLEKTKTHCSLFTSKAHNFLDFSNFPFVFSFQSWVALVQLFIIEKLLYLIVCPLLIQLYISSSSLYLYQSFYTLFPPRPPAQIAFMMRTINLYSGIITLLCFLTIS